MLDDPRIAWLVVVLLLSGIGFLAYAGVTSDVGNENDG
jgi:hypothetical protein